MTQEYTIVRFRSQESGNECSFPYTPYTLLPPNYVIHDRSRAPCNHSIGGILSRLEAGMVMRQCLVAELLSCILSCTDLHLSVITFLP